MSDAFASAHPAHYRDGLGGRVGVVGPSGAGGVLGGGIDKVEPSPCCDPILHVSYGWSDALTPLNYIALEVTPTDKLP